MACTARGKYCVQVHPLPRWESKSTILRVDRYVIIIGMHGDDDDDDNNYICTV